MLSHPPVSKHTLANRTQAPKGSTGREDPDPLGGLTVREGHTGALVVGRGKDTQAEWMSVP